MANAEQDRLEEARNREVPWRTWGPYLSERQWGTVREDYSENGDAWNFFTHDHARSRAYRWGEDGLAGISDDRQRLCFALALWNGNDAILKERLFGLTNSEGNHGEDVKEVLLLPRQHADRLVHEVSVQVPARGVSLRRPAEDQRRAQPQRDGVRAARYWRLQGRSLLRRLRRVRQGRVRKTSSFASRRSTGDRTQRTFTCSRRCGSATTGRSGLPNRTELPRNHGSGRSRRRQARRLSRRLTRCWANSSFTATATCRCSSPRTRPTTSGCSTARRTRARTSKTASTTAWCWATRPR